MSNDISQYFREVDGLCRYLLVAKRDRVDGQLFSSRRRLDEQQRVWCELRVLLIKRNEAIHAEIVEMCERLGDLHRAVQLYYAFARAEMRTVRRLGSIGTASEIVANAAGQVLSWLVEDPAGWGVAFHNLCSAEDVRDLRDVFEASDSRFPVCESDVHELLVELAVQKSVVLRVAATVPRDRQASGCNSADETIDCQLSEDHEREIKRRLEDKERVPEIAKVVGLTQGRVLGSRAAIAILSTWVGKQQTLADKLGVDRSAISRACTAASISWPQGRGHPNWGKQGRNSGNSQ